MTQRAYHYTKDPNRNAGDSLRPSPRMVDITGADPDFKRRFNDYWPLSLSQFGYDIIHGSHTSGSNRTVLVELFFEHIRELGFPECPSRLCCVFGCEPNIASAAKWKPRLLNKPGTTNLWEVTADLTSWHDAKWLDIIDFDHVSIPVWTYYAEKYWGHSTFDSPAESLPELLLSSPVEFVRLVDGV